jgi:hypothetical protein
MIPFNRTRPMLTGACVCAALLLPIATGARAQTGCAPESFTAAAVSRADGDAGAGLRIDIHVAAWTVEREKIRLVHALAERGTAAFANALAESMPVGEIRAAGRRPSPVRFAWQERLDDGGRRLLLITDRTLAYWTDMVRPAGEPDTFTLIEIRIPLGCEGEGKVGSASDVRVNRNFGVIELTDYDAAPVRLTNVITGCMP